MVINLNHQPVFKDPFDLKEFPYKDKKLEDGTIIKGVPRHQRLRTVVGMFYKDRHDKQSEISKLRSMIVFAMRN